MQEIRYVAGYSYNGTNNDISAKVRSCREPAVEPSYDNGYDGNALFIGADNVGNAYVTGYSINRTDYDVITIKYDTDRGRCLDPEIRQRLWTAFLLGAFDPAGNIYVTGLV